MAAITGGPGEYLSVAEGIMRDVYGDWSSDGWVPESLPEKEAAPALYGGQRRHLLVDAFGVLNFVSFAEQQTGARQRYLSAASKLIDSVHQCLGNPRSAEYPMQKASDREGGYQGLRIGNRVAPKDADNSSYVDAMYWNALGKWIFALARYAGCASDAVVLQRGVRLVKQVHPRFLVRSANGRPLGLRWKMNADLTNFHGFEDAGPNDDAVSGLVAYTALERARIMLGVQGRGGSLDSEIADLTNVVFRFAAAGGFQMACEDPLGFGSQCFHAQFYAGLVVDPLLEELRTLASSALHASHSALPFRLYVGILGARLGRDAALAAPRAERLLAQLTPQEARRSVGDGDFSCMNKVCFASALCPQAFERRPEEHIIDL